MKNHIISGLTFLVVSLAAATAMAGGGGGIMIKPDPAIPEPNAGLLFAIGGAVVALGLRLRHRK